MSQKVTVSSFTLVRSRRRTLSVEIHPTPEIVVRSPVRTSLPDILLFLRERQGWITERLERIHQQRTEVPPLTSPNSFYFKGEERIWQGALALYAQWERKQARIVFREVLDELIPAIGLGGLRFQDLSVRTMKRRWGSCSTNGRIVLNTLLVRTPERCIRAVIAHELAHLVHMNHGPHFKALVRDILPDYDTANKELDRWTWILCPTPVSAHNGQVIPWLTVAG